jgi:RHS repeat-associated protein
VSGSGGTLPTHAYAYRPFGTLEIVTEPGGAFNPLRFTGQYFDSETGLCYTRARYYDPTLRRFISEDPIGLAGGINPLYLPKTSSEVVSSGRAAARFA